MHELLNCRQVNAEIQENKVQQVRQEIEVRLKWHALEVTPEQRKLLHIYWILPLLEIVVEQSRHLPF